MIPKLLHPLLHHLLPLLSLPQTISHRRMMETNNRPMVTSLEDNLPLLPSRFKVQIQMILIPLRKLIRMHHTSSTKISNSNNISSRDSNNRLMVTSLKDNPPLPLSQVKVQIPMTPLLLRKPTKLRNSNNRTSDSNHRLQTLNRAQEEHLELRTPATTGSKLVSMTGLRNAFGVDGK